MYAVRKANHCHSLYRQSMRDALHYFCAFHIHILPKCTKLTTMLYQTIWENIRAVENLFVTLMRLCEKIELKPRSMVNEESVKFNFSR